MEMTDLQDKDTALLNACKQQNVSIDKVKSLIESGADVNITDKLNDMTALMFVIDSINSTSKQYNVLTIINLLIQNNANINAQTKEGKTALMMVCQKCNPDDDRDDFIFRICDTFLTNPKIDLSIKDQDNKTALDYANENCNQNIKDLLFSRYQAKPKPKRWWQKFNSSPAGGRRRKTIRRKSKRKSKRKSRKSRKYKI